MIGEVLRGIHNRIRLRALAQEDNGPLYEYCPRCDANLTMQKGYSSDLPYWECKGCGEMLINPAFETESGIIWKCDGCGALLNIQPGFSEDCGEWACTECGFSNKINDREIYSSEDEFQAALKDPYKGLSDMDVLALSLYRDEEQIDGSNTIIRVRNRENGEYFIKKLLTTYDRSVYDYLKANPIEHMPQIIELFESDNCLIVIEELIPGRTVESLLEKEALSEQEAVRIAKDLCEILDVMHSLPTPIIHRDIKPSNIMVTEDGEVVLLDMNVAKWYKPDKTDDTRYLGTMYYAAPEQVGYGLSASSAKSDIYALGILLNVMLTRKLPKEERATGRMWDIIERCISLDAKVRPTAAELRKKLEDLSF